MEKQNPLQPLWYDSSRAEEELALSQEPRDRRTRDENAGGTRFHTRSTTGTAAEAIIRKRLIEQEENDHLKRRTLSNGHSYGNGGDSSVINSDSILTSDDEYPQHTRVDFSSRPSNASSESVYHFHRVPSSPPAYLSQHPELPSSPERPEPTPDQQDAIFTSQATMIPPSDLYSSDSDSTVDFNINTLNRVHGYISSDYLASDPTFGDHYNEEEVNLSARSRIAQSIEDGNPKVYLEHLGLKTIPDDIEDLRNLVCWGRNGVEVPKIEIYATHNKLRILPPTLFNITNLSVLSLRDNKLKKLPGKIQELKKLTYLSVVGNEIKVLPYQILNLPLLTELLVRPNPNLIELKDQDPSAYFCVADESSSHDVDVRRYVSRVKWSDLPVSASSQLQAPIVNDREMLDRVSPIPRLSELALRCFSKYNVTLTETRIWKKSIPTWRQKMIAKALQKGIYDENCSVCDTITVNPIAKALEWWDFKTQKLVPVRRNFCCANCVRQWLDDVDAAKKRYEDQMDVEVEGPEVAEPEPVPQRSSHDLRFDEDF